jgi:hypothetical protein
LGGFTGTNLFQYPSNVRNIAMHHSFSLLTTLRLTLSSFNNSTDTSAVFAYASDPEVARFTSWMPDSAAWIDGIKGSDSAEPGRSTIAGRSVCAAAMKQQSERLNSYKDQPTWPE